MQKNVIQTQLTDELKSQIAEKVTELETLLNGKLSALTEEERKQYGSINEQNKLLVNKIRDYQNTQPALASPEVNWNEFENDYQARQFLEHIMGRLQSIAFQMGSTKILHDYDNYHNALTDYAYAQYRKGAGSNGFTEKVAGLKQFFPRASNSPTSDSDSDETN